MRTFYVFKINREMTLLMKESPYNLFKSLEGIYLLDKTSVGYGKDLLDQIITPIDKMKYNRLIYDKNKDNDFYMKIGDNHRIINKYRKEETNIQIKNSHILLKTNIINTSIGIIPEFNLLKSSCMKIINIVGVSLSFLPFDFILKYSLHTFLDHYHFSSNFILFVNIMQND